MYLELLIDNIPKRMYLGYIENFVSGSRTDKIPKNSTMRIVKMGTSLRNLLNGKRPNEIKFTSGDTFAVREKYASQVKDYSSNNFTVEIDEQKKRIPKLPPAQGKTINVPLIDAYYYRIANVFGKETAVWVDTSSLFFSDSGTITCNDIMFFATDEIINDKRTIFVLFNNKYTPKIVDYKPNCRGYEGIYHTSYVWYNLNYFPFEIGFTNSLLKSDYGYSPHALFYLGTAEQSGKNYRELLIDSIAVTQYADFFYSNLIKQSELTKKFQRAIIRETLEPQTENNIDYAYWSRAYNIANISDSDNPYPPTPDIPDLPLPDPDNPTDPENPDNPDNLEPDPSDPIPPPKPSPSPTFSAKFITAYRLNQDNLNALADEMWTSNFYDNIVKMFVNPMDCLISLSEYPINVPAGAQQAIQLGNVEMSTAASVVRNPFVEVELGTCQLTEKYQSYLDYMNTRIEIFLPFIGFEQISIDYMNSILSLKYNVDILSGNCVAILSATSFNSNLNSVVGQWNGNMAYSIPLSGRDFSQMASSLWNTATSAASVIASSKIPTIAPSGFSKGGGGGFGLPSLSSVADLGNNIINTIEAANATTSGGHLSANSGHLSMLTPYLIITRPVQKINANYYASFGRTLDAYTPFSALSGYTKVKSCNLSIPSATQDEILAIDKLLKEGVIF